TCTTVGDEGASLPCAAGCSSTAYARTSAFLTGLSPSGAVSRPESATGSGTRIERGAASPDGATATCVRGWTNQGNWESSGGRMERSNVPGSRSSEKEPLAFV